MSGNRRSFTPRRILIRGPNPVGDLVMATASLADVRKAFPDAEISLLLKPGRESVVDGSGNYDHAIVDDSHEGIGAFFRLARDLRARRFDLCILFTHSFRSALAIALAGIPVRVGYPKGGQSFLLTRRVPPEMGSGRKWKPLPMPEIYARLCDAAGVPRATDWLQLAVGDELEVRYQESRRLFGLAEGEKLIGLVPGAAFGASKLWPAERMAEVADRLTERYELRTMLFAGPGEEGIAQKILAAMKTEPINSLDHPPGLDLLKPYIRDLELLLTMDTGPRHYATAFRVPTLCIMGPTDPDWTNSHLDHQDVVRRDVDCGPCHLKTCPLDHRCMTLITPDEVMDRIEVLVRNCAEMKREFPRS